MPDLTDDTPDSADDTVDPGATEEILEEDTGDDDEEILEEDEGDPSRRDELAED